MPHEGTEEFIWKLSDEVKRRAPIGVYQHFKGGLYIVVGYGVDAERNKPTVRYRSLDPERHDSDELIRTLDNFLEVVDRPDHSYQGPRFFLLQIGGQ